MKELASFTMTLVLLLQQQFIVEARVGRQLDNLVIDDRPAPSPATSALPVPITDPAHELVAKGSPATFDWWTPVEHPHCVHSFDISIGPTIVSGPIGLICQGPSPRFTYRSDLLMEATESNYVSYPGIIGGAIPLCMEIISGILELHECDPFNTNQHFIFVFEPAAWDPENEVMMFMKTASGSLVDFNIFTGKVSVVKGVDPTPSAYLSCFSPSSSFFPPGTQPLQLDIP